MNIIWGFIYMVPMAYEDVVQYNPVFPLTDADITDICSSMSSYVTQSGYISTPNFPNEYPPDLHCTCSLNSLVEDSQIRLDFTHFIIKYDYPCKDWVEIVMDGQVRRLCGAYRSTLLSAALNLTFHSDSVQGHQGLWLHFTGWKINDENIPCYNIRV